MFVQDDGKSIATGEPFQQTAQACYDLSPDQLVAVGVNCSPPGVIEPLITGINDNRSKRIPLIIYPNSGEKYSVETG